MAPSDTVTLVAPVVGQPTVCGSGPWAQPGPGVAPARSWKTTPGCALPGMAGVGLYPVALSETVRTFASFATASVYVMAVSVREAVPAACAGVAAAAATSTVSASTRARVIGTGTLPSGTAVSAG